MEFHTLISVTRSKDLYGKVRAEGNARRVRDADWSGVKKSAKQNKAQHAKLATTVLPSTYGTRFPSNTSPKFKRIYSLEGLHHSHHHQSYSP